MAIPDYQTLMLPLLRRLGEEPGPVAIRQFLDSIATEFGLTEEERAQRIPSGSENLLVNRLAWARTYLGKAGLTSSPKRGVVVITDLGRALLNEQPERIDGQTLRRYPQFLDWLTASRPPSEAASHPVNAPLPVPPQIISTAVAAGTPRERIDQAMQELKAALRAELLDRVRAMTPTDFEGLIIRLLLAMGYGQGVEELAQALGGSGDGGMDGVVHQDPLGLDRVYIQAKRWREGNNVSSPEIRNFVGALNIHRATKGVFVTASQFTADARQAARGATVQVVLVDGERLTELLARYGVGVVTRDRLEFKEIDEGFFADGT